MILLAVCAALTPETGHTRGEPIYGKAGMAVSAEPLASEVGIAILRDGGNAFDAAVAMGFALAVTWPQAGNLGGGGFCIALTDDGETFALDFRETAPERAGRDMFVDADGKVVAGLSLASHLGVGVPGSVAGLLELHRRFGWLERSEVMAPAIRLAARGFEVSAALHGDLETGRAKLLRYQESADIFFRDGEPVAIGDLLVQRDLARTLSAINSKGRDGFYRGPVAELLVAEMEARGGLITGSDLAQYEAKWREPFAFTVQAGGHDFELITHPLPSSGGMTLAQILGLLDLDRLAEAPWNSAAYVHRVVEAERLAYSDRNHWLGDSDFVDVPVANLTSAAYLAERRKLLPNARAGQSSGVAHGQPESTETTHYCVADQWGNVVAITTTLNARFGLGAVVPGAGFFLNNEMDDFSARPGAPNLFGLTGAEANAVAPRKRMLSSMTPTIVRRDGAFWLTMGSPDGSIIITTVLQVFANAALFGMNVREAVDAPRFHHQWLPDVVAVEADALSDEAAGSLKEMGYKLVDRRRLGRVSAIGRMPDGRYSGWPDRRGSGAAVPLDVPVEDDEDLRAHDGDHPGADELEPAGRDVK